MCVCNMCACDMWHSMRRLVVCMWHVCMWYVTCVMCDVMCARADVHVHVYVFPSASACLPCRCSSISSCGIHSLPYMVSDGERTCTATCEAGMCVDVVLTHVNVRVSCRYMRHVRSGHVTSSYIMSYHVISCHVTSHACVAPLYRNHWLLSLQGLWILIHVCTHTDTCTCDSHTHARAVWLCDAHRRCDAMRGMRCMYWSM